MIIIRVVLVVEDDTSLLIVSSDDVSAVTQMHVTWSKKLPPNLNFEMAARLFLQRNSLNARVPMSHGVFKDNSPFGDVYVFIPHL